MPGRRSDDWDDAFEADLISSWEDELDWEAKEVSPDRIAAQRFAGTFNPLAPPTDDLVAQALHNLRVVELRELARHLGWPLRGQRREEIVAQLAVHYRDPASARSALERLNANDRRVITLLAWLGWGPPDALLRGLRRLADVLPPDWPARRISARDLDHLMGRGVLLPAGHPPGSVLTLGPSFARVVLPLAELAPSAAHPLPGRMAPPLSVRSLVIRAAFALVAHGPFHPGPSFEHDIMMFAYASGWPVYRADRHLAWRPDVMVRIPPVQPPLPPQLRPTLDAATGSEAADFVLSLLISAGLLVQTPDPQQPQAPAVEVNPSALDVFLSLSPERQLHALVQAWVDSGYGLWDEVSHLLNQQPGFRLVRRQMAWSFGPDAYSGELAARRLRALAMLQRLPLDADAPAGGWVDAVAFLRLSLQARPDFLAQVGPEAVWLFQDAEGQALDPASDTAWRLVGWPLWSFLFHGPLRWLGLVETAVDDQGQLTALRLSPAGRCLREDERLPPDDQSVATWGDDLAVTVTGQDAGLLGALHELGQVDRVTADGIRFRFTRPAVEACLERGSTAEELLAKLTAAGAVPPPALHRAITGWADRWGSVNLYRDIALLTFGDAATAREVLLDAGVRSRVVSQVSPVTVIVERQAVDEVVARLRHIGHTPKVDIRRPGGERDG